MALATAAQVRALAPGLSTADDTTIDALLARINAAFARFCGHPTPDSGAQTMEAATYTTFPGRYDLGIEQDRAIATLPTPPILSITSVHVDPEQDYGADTLLTASEYVADGRRVELLVGATHSWSDLPRANRVVVSAGYVVASHPVLTEAAIVQAIHAIGNTSAAGSTSTSTRGGSRSVAPLSLLPEVREMLTDYRLAVP
jgi:hypothetical protein